MDKPVTVAQDGLKLGSAVMEATTSPSNTLSHTMGPSHHASHLGGEFCKLTLALDFLSALAP